MTCLHCRAKIQKDETLCPECQKKDLPKHTKMYGGKVQSYQGLLWILGGLLLLALGIFFAPQYMIVYIGVCAVGCIAGVNNILDSRTVTCSCPECLFKGLTNGYEEKYHCPQCGRDSEKYRGFLILLDPKVEEPPEATESVAEAALKEEAEEQV